MRSKFDRNKESEVVEHLPKTHPPADRRTLSPLKKASFAGIAVGAILLASVMVLLVFSDFLVNRFVKPRITEAFAVAYPAYSLSMGDMNFNIFKNRIRFDSVTVSAVDSTFAGTIGPFSVSGISWMRLFWGGDLAPYDFANAIVDAKDIELNFPDLQYELRCGLLHVSVPDSEIVVEDLQLHPADVDEQFFAGSKLRQTRFRLEVPQARIRGCACLALLEGNVYRARSMHIPDLFLDVLINKDKPFAKDAPNPPMPNEILSSIPGTVQVDSLSIMNGRLKYAERFAVGSQAALITLDSMQVLAEEKANDDGRVDGLIIKAQGQFMKAGAMSVLMSIPIASPEFSYQFSGSMSRMDLSVLNSFLEIAEQKRIKTGILHEATFEINVSSGRASGNVRPVYSDLTIAVINKQTGSDKGFLDGFASAVAKSFKIRGSNMPDNAGPLKTGKVKYTRKRGEFFMEFTWFALRSGVGDVVGF